MMTVKLKQLRVVQLLIRNSAFSPSETIQMRKEYFQNVQILSQEEQAGTGVQQR